MCFGETGFPVEPKAIRMVEKREWIVVVAGALAPAVFLVTFAVSGLSSPMFDWPSDPFSVIGATDGGIALAFNAGLTLGGLASLPFAVLLWRAVSRLVGGAYAVVGLSFAGAGLFPGTPGAVAHEIFGALAFLGIWLLLWLAGYLDWRAGKRRAGATALALGSVALLVWLPYDFGLQWAQIGYGAAEAVSLSAFALWSVRTAVRLRDRSAPGVWDRRREMSS